MYLDLGAEKIIAAERANKKIAVEIKSFLGVSAISEFHTALGQFINYRYALLDFAPDRVLYLAVSVNVYDYFFSQSFIQSVIQISQVNLLIYDDEIEEIVEWRNEMTTASACGN